MKKNVIFLALVLIVLGACSPESNDNQSLEIDLSQIVNPETVKAAATFDNSQKGIYRGVFTAIDATYHGELTINVGNDGKYNAVLVVDGEKYGFVRQSYVNNTNAISYVGNMGRFDLQILDNNKAVIENAEINNTPARAKVLKETSQNRVMMSLGTFEDENDATFDGTWDLLSTSQETISVPTGLPFPATIDVVVNIVDEIYVMRTGGTEFTDETMENFTPGTGCGDSLPPGSQAPFFTGAQTLSIFGQTINIDEWAMSNQTSNFSDREATWTLNYSLFQGNIYYDANCNENTNPVGGRWSWDGRTGIILID